MPSEQQLNKLLTQGMKYAEEFNIKESKRAEYASAYVDYFYTMKQADRKARQLEALSHQKYYEGVLNYAYARAQKDISKWSGVDYSKDSKYQRWSRKPPESLSGIYAKINDAQRFNDAVTSSKSGITNMYKKRAETLSVRYSTKSGGAELTWQEVADYFEKEYNKKLDNKVGSSSVFIALGVIKRYGIDDLKLFEEIKKMKADDDYANKVSNKSDEFSKKVTSKFNEINVINKDGRFVKSAKIDRDITEILKQEDIDVKILFADTKKGKKKNKRR